MATDFAVPVKVWQDRLLFLLVRWGSRRNPCGKRVLTSDKPPQGSPGPRKKPGGFGKNAQGARKKVAETGWQGARSGRVNHILLLSVRHLPNHEWRNPMKNKQFFAIICFLLCAVMATALFACGGGGWGQAYGATAGNCKVKAKLAYPAYVLHILQFRRRNICENKRKNGQIAQN